MKSSSFSIFALAVASAPTFAAPIRSTLPTVEKRQGSGLGGLANPLLSGVGNLLDGVNYGIDQSLHRIEDTSRTITSSSTPAQRQAAIADNLKAADSINVSVKEATDKINDAIRAA